MYWPVTYALISDLTERRIVRQYRWSDLFALVAEGSDSN
jgi:hypothetical protein